MHVQACLPACAVRLCTACTLAHLPGSAGCAAWCCVARVSRHLFDVQAWGRRASEVFGHCDFLKAEHVHTVGGNLEYLELALGAGTRLVESTQRRLPVQVGWACEGDARGLGLESVGVGHVLLWMDMRLGKAVWTQSQKPFESFLNACVAVFMLV